MGRLVLTEINKISEDRNPIASTQPMRGQKIWMINMYHAAYVINVRNALAQGCSPTSYSDNHD